MSDDEKPDVSLLTMVAGVMYALAARGVRGLDFYTLNADRAMVAVFEFLSGRGVFDLRFRLMLDELHGDCPDWAGIRRFGLGLYFRRWSPGGPCELLMSKDALDDMMRRESLPGTRELWLECADVFVEAYDQPEGRS